jgi:hypothetical protein
MLWRNEATYENTRGFLHCPLWSQLGTPHWVTGSYEVAGSFPHLRGRRLGLSPQACPQVSLQ